MYRLDTPVMNYDWGSETAIAAIRGVEPSGHPEAELWVGAHHVAPSMVKGPGQPLSLAQLIASAPDLHLGAHSGDSTLPFLMKILAAERPLSLQVHPSLEQARSGFANEEAIGMPLHAPDRIFRDQNHKPELLCALTNFDALCGFRDPLATVDLLGGLDGGELGKTLVRIITASPNERGLHEALTRALSVDRSYATESVAGLQRADEEPVNGFEAECRWISRLAVAHPHDPAVFVAAMLGLFQLEPGQALFLAAGSLHTYLHGVGVEILASSDNVARAGMTSKHVDVGVVAQVVDPAVEVLVQTPATDNWTFDVPADDFSVTRLVLHQGDEPELVNGPALVMPTEGSASLANRQSSESLRGGEAAFVSAADGDVTLTGEGLVFVAAQGARSA